MKKIFFSLAVIISSTISFSQQLTCGQTFVDSGDLDSTYTNNEIDTFHICPQVVGESVQLTFTSFETESNYDFLTIYDSDQAGTNPLGTFSGTLALGTFLAENPTGCLTVVFTSDGSVIGEGWAATISCVAAPTCIRPSNLQVSSITANSASFSWQSNDTEVRWILEYGPNGFTPGTGTDVVSLTNPKTINTFNGLTNYDVYVRARCAIGDTSSYFGPISFVTLPTPLACGDTFTDSGSDTSSYQNNEDYIYTACPSLPTETVNVVFSAFDLENGFDELTIFDANDTTTGTEIGVYTGLNMPSDIIAENATGCLTFRFTSDGSVANDGWIATINCIPEITCFKPIELSTSNPTDVSIDLSWTAMNGETQWIIEYDTTGFLLGTGNTVVANSNPLTINGLNATTQYDFYVRSICSANDSSFYSIAATGSTIGAPLVCGNSFTDLGGPNNDYSNNANETYVICPTSASQVVLLSFSSFETEQNWDSLMIYNGNSTSSPLIGIYQGTNSPGDIYSTSTDGCLTVNFQSDGIVPMAGWVASIQCVDPITCIQPTNLIVDSTTSTSITLSWTANSSETQWLIEYDTVGFTLGTGTTVIATSNPFEITGLTSSTNFDFYVSAICSSTDSSFSTGPLNGQTELAPFTCGNLFLDNGGSDIYANNSNDTTTICPNGTFELVSVIFTSFETESDFDSLMVYNGSSTSDPLIGTYQGLNDSIGTITSTNPNGCLTFVFESDGSVNLSGWSAQIACIDANVSVSENELNFVSVYPNPSEEKFTIKNTHSGEVSFELRDIQGRKLNLNKSNLKALESTSLDLTNYDSGMYFLVINGTQTLNLIKK